MARDRLERRAFPGQRANEQIQVFVRKHWIIDVKVASAFFLLAVLPTVLYLLGVFYFWNGELDLAKLTALLGFLVYMLYAMLITYVKWLNEELDIILVTNQRVISHDQIDLFHREISEANVGQVQDVKGIEKGLFGHLLHYGELVIQTAARDIFFTIKNVDKPYEKARAILDLRDVYLDREKFETMPQPPPSPIFRL